MVSTSIPGRPAARHPTRVAADVDPPADRVDIAAFTAKTLADELVARLDQLGLARTWASASKPRPTRARPSPGLAHDPHPPARRPSSRPRPRLPFPGPRRHDPGPGSSRDPWGRMAAVMAERVRWQLDGWLAG